MKRYGLLTNCLALAAWAMLCPLGKAEEKKETPKAADLVIEGICCPPTCVDAVVCIDALVGTNAAYGQVQELIAILNETKSPCTLVATTIALVPLGEKAKVAVPAILRNAERLKVLESFGNPESRKGGLANMLVDAIYIIQGGENAVMQTRVAPPVAQYPYPPPAASCVPVMPPPVAPTPRQ